MMQAGMQKYFIFNKKEVGTPTTFLLRFIKIYKFTYRYVHTYINSCTILKANGDYANR